ncbi:hypothetical protein R20943_03776 [Paraburkholderia aspalathi]|nr:hypothetical protein R20943_03776 [Paraburkholderia aspalathi]
MLTHCAIMTVGGTLSKGNSGKPGKRPRRECVILRRGLCNSPPVYFSFDYEGYSTSGGWQGNVMAGACPRVSIVEAAPGGAADLENDLADAFEQGRRRARDQPVAWALVCGAAAIDGVALARGADES